MTATGAETVPVPDLHLGDTIHVSPHEVFRHSEDPHPVTCQDADVLVDSVLDVKGIIVIICWHIPREDRCRAVCGATAYDADDCVLRVAAAA